MSSREKARVYFAEVNFAGGYIDMLEKLLDSHAAESTRETLAAWMIKWGYATGHGDTTEDLLEELREQIEEGKVEQRMEFIDELSVYLLKQHGGITASDGELVGYFLDATGEE